MEGVDLFAPPPPAPPTEAELAAQRALVARFPVLGRGVADIRDRVAWAKARAPMIGASDAAKFSKVESAHLYLKAKLYAPFSGNGYTAHGNAREPFMLAAYNIEQNFTLFHSADNPRHGATPDGIKLGGDGTFVLAQAKTTLVKTKTLRTGEVVEVPAFTNARGERAIPPDYQRQMWWEQYVMGTDRTLFIWEAHRDGQPVDMEPESVWFHRDDNEIHKLITIADIVLEGMDAAAEFEREMQS